MAAGHNWRQLVLRNIKPTGKEIGKGSFARVFEVNYEGTLCAAKEAILLKYAGDKELQKIKSDFLRECQIWSTLRHPCVVQFLGLYYPALDQSGLPVIVMEKMSCSLRQLVEKYNNIPLNVKLSILDEVCLGLRYLHTRNPPIFHRDLTPNNVLLGSRLEAKITDLGVAVIAHSSTSCTMTKAPGTMDFMPPESLADKPIYGLPLDIFSFGGVVLYTATQQWPQPSSWVQFDSESGQSVYLSEVRRRQQYLDTMTGCAADLKPLVTSCLADNPKNRPVVEEVSAAIKKVKEHCSQQNDHDGMSCVAWWAEVGGETKEESGASGSSEDQSNIPLGIKWKQGPYSPVGRVGHSVVKLNDLLYVGGGAEAGMRPSYRIDTYNINTNSWCSPPINTPYHFFGMACLSDSLIVAGGKDDTIFRRATNKVFKLENNNQLKEYTRMTRARYHMAIEGHDNMLIIAGGVDDDRAVLTSTEVFDSTTGQWYSCSNLPDPIFWVQTTVVDNTMYIMSGRDRYKYPTSAMFSTPLNTLSTHQLNWTTSQDTPRSRATPVCVLGEHLLIMGGLNEEGNDFVHTADIFMLNKTTDNWQNTGYIPLSRCVAAAISVAPDKMIVIGGVDERGHPTNTIWIGSCDPQ